jgi:hypothetical protein
MLNSMQPRWYAQVDTPIQPYRIRISHFFDVEYKLLVTWLEEKETYLSVNVDHSR